VRFENGEKLTRRQQLLLLLEEADQDLAEWPLAMLRAERRYGLCVENEMAAAKRVDQPVGNLFF